MSNVVDDSIAVKSDELIEVQKVTKNKHITESLSYNNTNYPLALKSSLNALDFNEQEAEKLRYHQFIVKEYFTHSQARGLLVCHGMGQGKTRLAVAIAEACAEQEPRRQCILLSAKSLASNFSVELQRYSGKSEAEIARHYKFISLNSSNMFKKVSAIDKTSDEAALEKKFGDFLDDVVKKSSLENSLLIIDEAHNLFNSITNGAKNALALYDLICETTNVKLVFLSGTPVINDPFELVPCFNMLRGRLPVMGSHELTGSHNSIKGGCCGDGEQLKLSDKLPNYHFGGKAKGFGQRKRVETTLLFSEDIDEFRMYFVDERARSIKNTDKFKNRIFGLTSYYGDLYFPADKAKAGFPEELPTVVERVPMSTVQYARYITARMSELDETKKGFRSSDSRFSSSSGGSSTYRVKSRQISNYCIPEYALGPARGNKSREKFINKISTDDLLDAKFSPKMARVIENFEKTRQKSIVYSQFVSGEGLAIFAKILEARGYVQWQIGSSRDSYSNTFAILSGDIDPEERAATIVEFNDANSTINLLLLSGAVAEGIDLKRIRHVHIMEPFWNYARINQVKTRAIRYLSHEDLPEDERNVSVTIYLSDYPTDADPKQKSAEETTDIDLYNKSLRNMAIINSFMKVLAESSMDCSAHHAKLDPSVASSITCKLCAPNNKQLFHPLLSKDMTLPNNCSINTEKKVTVEEIKLPDYDETFYYTRDPIKLYHYNKMLSAYTALLRTHPLYADLYNAVIVQHSND